MFTDSIQGYIFNALLFIVKINQRNLNAYYIMIQKLSSYQVVNLKRINFYNKSYS